MKISLIHPSRGRPEKAKAVYEYWMAKSSGNADIEHILSLDISDPTSESYEVFGINSKIIINHNNSVVEATNQAAKCSTGDILVYLSDDFKCPENWDELIISEFRATDPTFLKEDGFFGEESPAILKVCDCLQKFNRYIITIPIMNRLLYKLLGYFFNPLYKSMFVDNDLYYTCKKIGAIVECPQLKFPHHHHSVGKSPIDDTYRRSESTFEEGRKIFNERKLAGFPL